ncbi:MAG: glutathione S-transferase family protein [Hyphomonadaceae bacterium]|nr:glutathione S-transferase family protein [Hyphomonadaceae bacterium]
MAKPILYVGNKNYSSWSMRPWLALTWAGIAFEERVIALGGPGYGKSKIGEVLRVSPSGRVPALHVGDLVIYDSLAICEWAAEQAPSLWPADAGTRARARSASAEMHSGFAALRRDLSMNVKRRMQTAPTFPEDTHADLARLYELWGELRGRYAKEGPYLLGARSIADAMYAPVATRLRTYAVAAPEVAKAYCETIFADEGFRAWERGAEAESWTIASADELYR